MGRSLIPKALRKYVYYEEPDIVLLHGDCLDMLPHFEKDSIDLVLTDPPYELSDTGPGPSHYGMSLNKFDSDEYKSIVGGFDYNKIFPLIFNICHPFNLFCFCSNKQITKIMGYGELNGFSTNLLIWHKNNAVPFANGVWKNDIEFCVHTKASGAVFQGNAEIKSKVFQHPIVTGKRHVTEKPLPLINKYMQIGSNKGQVVLDPLLGSGTTAVACKQLGRKCIGIDIESKYLDIAIERLRQPGDEILYTKKEIKNKGFFI